jgi:chitin disaccharide deacetylase
VAKVLINADDFGMSDGVCRSILELLDIGAVSNTTLMLAVDGAAARMKKWNARSLLGVAGVHLQLTSGVPLSPPSEVASLVDPATGRFWAREDIYQIDPHEVEREWSRQIEAAMSVLGGIPTHLDSHRGVSRIPECIPIFVSLAQQYGLSVRGHPGETERIMTDLGVSGSISVAREWTGRGLPSSDLVSLVQQKVDDGAQIIEVVTHPGYNDPYLMKHSGLNHARENDHQVLRELVLQGWPESSGHVRVSFPLPLAPAPI